MFRLSRHTLYSYNKFLYTTTLIDTFSNILFVWLPPKPTQLYPFFHKDKVLDAELSPAVLPVDHGSQRYCGGPVTEAHIRHMRKKAPMCTPRSQVFPSIFWLVFQAVIIQSQFKSHWMPCLVVSNRVYFQGIETWTLSKNSKICFGTTTGVGYWVNLSETLFDSSTG